MKKWLKIIVFQIFLVVYRDVFTIIAPAACAVSFLLFKMVGLACIMISLPFSHYIFKRINDTPAFRKDVKELEEFLEKLRKD